MRLFGAYQVPWLMNTIYQAKYGPYEGKEHMVPIQNNLSNGEPLYEFWRSWRYSQAMPLKTPLWTEYSRVAPMSLLCAACENNQMALDNLTITDFWYHYAFSAESDQELQQMIKKYISGPVQRVGIKNVMSGRGYNSNLSKMYSNVEIVSQHIGFLFLIIENVSDGYLGDIRLKYKESASNKGINLENKSSMVGCQDYNFDFSRLATPALVTMELESTSIENQKILYGLKKGESILWLLAVYIKDDTGFPKKYLSSVVKPTQITYRDPISQSLVTFKVRDPLGERAAIIAVPFGWHGQ